MHFNPSDLHQLTPEYLASLSPDRVVVLFGQLREDHFRVLDRLNQNPSNSSRPPSSQAPWDQSAANSKDKSNNPKRDKDEDNPEEGNDGKSPPSSNNGGEKQKRKPGRQPGSPGFGRTQKFTDVLKEVHRPCVCKGCSKTFPDNAHFLATFSYETLDLLPPKPGTIGITGTCTQHVFGKSLCSCGFETDSVPYRAPPEEGWSKGLGEWRLIGPGLLSFMVFAKYKLHLTIGKIKLLVSHLGISLSEGVIAEALVEAGQAVNDLDPSILDALRASSLINMDETSWQEKKITRWLWVAVGETAVYFAIGGRTKEMARDILGNFAGWLMTDGYGAYRTQSHRIRCWAHLRRKAKGLEESAHPIQASFGKMALAHVEAIQESVYKMRDLMGPSREKEQEVAEEKQALFCCDMLRHRESTQEPIRTFAGEILNDPQAIFAIVQNPDLPLTNNVAERALRPMVILRKLSHGSKSPHGALSTARLASVYETVVLRAADIISFLTEVFYNRRHGVRSPPLPQPP